jgi:hypothetical protein
MKIVYVRWTDACSESGLKKINDLDPEWECESAGILVREDSKHVSFSQDVFSKSAEARQTTHIPRENIRELRIVDLGKMSKRRR